MMAARGGARVLVLERAVFPRDKVCGDCLNPECWDVFDRLGLTEGVRALPRAVLERVSFVSRGGRTIEFEMETSERGEIAVRRRYLDQLLLQGAVRDGAEVRQNAAVTTVTRGSSGWEVNYQLEGQNACVRSSFLVAADGRNSIVARLLGLQGRRGSLRD